MQSGTLPIAESNRHFAVGRGQWLLLRAGHRHYGCDDMTGDTWFYWICFGHGTPQSIESAVLRAPPTGSVVRPDRLRSLFENLLDDQGAAILSLPAARSYLNLVLAEILLEPRATSGETASADVAQRAAAFIAEHLTESDLTTARIAGALAFNADYLGRAFRRAFNETVTEHIHRLRVDWARMLFRSTNRSIERVASEVGFSDDRYFRRIFKRKVGLTPGQFQRLHPSQS